MEKLTLLAFDYLLMLYYSGISFILSMVIQGLVYRTTKFNIINYIINKMIKE